jgi:hypothetical protein
VASISFVAGEKVHGLPNTVRNPKGKAVPLGNEEKDSSDGLEERLRIRQ